MTRGDLLLLNSTLETSRIQNKYRDNPYCYGSGLRFAIVAVLFLTNLMSCYITVLVLKAAIV
jgi:hypothetical protein